MVIGLTGGIGCGKSTAAGFFKELGAYVIDADAIGKTILEQNPDLQEAILLAFGRDLADARGAIDRKALGNRVFSDPEKLDQLNRMIHPRLWEEVRQSVERARSEKHPLIVVDAALIFEVGLEPLFDGILVIASTLENRIARLRQRDGLSREAIMNRIRRQMDLEEKIQKADWVIANDAAPETLYQNLLAWYRRLMADGASADKNYA